MAIAHPDLKTGFTANEQALLRDLIIRRVITEEQASDVLETHRKHRTHLREILGAKGYIRQHEYARLLSQVSQNAYFDLDSAYDAALIRQFSPALMMRYLFCPLQCDGRTITLLVADPAEDAIDAHVQAMLPDINITKVIGSEMSITRIINTVFGSDFIHNAVNALREARPEQSASRVFTYPQIISLAVIVIAIVIGLTLNFWGTATLLVVLFSTLYLVAIFYKFVLSMASMFSRQSLTAADMESIDDADLPIYSILIPVYKEPNVIPHLLKALSRMDYPQEKLDVLLLMEADDHETIASAKAANPPSYFRFIIVPDSLPRTKPKACNYGLHFCRGEYVTIYDAEDIPEPDQLRKAVAAFRKGGEQLICVQAALNYFNSTENYLTRMFTLEYSYWFDYLLPGLDRLGLPIPLGGTSNHFRIRMLRELDAWDPFNVTEDADLGIRISARGYTVGVIRSTTYEEANKAYKNWIRQRSRWIKGYMQTWLVHNRNPLRLLRQIGLKDWLSYQFFIGGTFSIFLINPVMWFFFAYWLLLRPVWMSQLFAGWVWDIAVFSLIAGNSLAVLLNMIATLRRRQYRLLLYALTNPFYWCLHSIAAYIGLYQLITKPFYWEKTEHGLTSIAVDSILQNEMQPSQTG